MINLKKIKLNNMLNQKYIDLQELLSVESDSPEMELVYEIVALETLINQYK